MQNNVKKAIEEMSNTLNNAPGDEITMNLYRDLLSKLNDIEKCYEEEKKLIVEQLEEELKLADEEKRRCASENPIQFDNAKGYSTGISNALDIVKGGVDNG